MNVYLKEINAFYFDFRHNYNFRCVKKSYFVIFIDICKIYSFYAICILFKNISVETGNLNFQ